MQSLIHFLFFSEFNASLALYILWLSDFLALITAPSILIRRSGSPLAALSWLLTIFGIPLIGVLLWWIIGRTHLQRKLNKRETKAEAFSQCSTEIQNACRSIPFIDYFKEGPKNIEMDSELSILSSGNEAFIEMEFAISRAKYSIYLMFYIWKTDATGKKWVSLIKSARERGVKVYILIDATGSRSFIAKYTNILRKIGCEVAVSNNPKLGIFSSNINFRNHRKLLVVDEHLAFTGGMNIGLEYKELWQDLMIQVSGPLVWQLALIFAEEWYHATEKLLSFEHLACEPCSTPSFTMSKTHHRTHMAKCYVIDSGPDKESNDTFNAWFMAINSANERICITTPYFIPGPAIEMSLKAAAKRGVQIDILVPEKSDVPLVGYASRTYFPRLLKEKIRIYLYKKSFIHRKSIIVDSDLSILGSANVDIRSFKLNFELSILIQSKSINNELDDIFKKSIGSSLEIKMDDLSNRKVYQLLADSVAHLMSPLL